MEMDSLNSMKDEKAHTETTNLSLVQENQMFLQQSDDQRDMFENLCRGHEELEVRSKAEVKVLVREVKSLRTTQSELKQERSVEITTPNLIQALFIIISVTLLTLSSSSKNQN